MVDFNNETTVTTPAKDVMKIYLLQCKAYCEDTWRRWRKVDFDGVNTGGLAEVRSTLEQWYIVMEALINRHWKDKELKKENILTKIEKGTKEDILKLIISFNRLLDETKLTRLDTRQVTGKTWEASNIAEGR